MGAVACLERLRDDLEHNTRLTDEARSRMVQAVDHLERAIGTPGWSEWVRHGMSLPIYAPDLPPEVRGAWSASRSLETDWVDVHSLTALRDKNKNGTTLQELVEAGQKAIDKAVQHALSEDLAAEEVRAKKVEKSAKTGHTLAQSNAASRPKAAFSRRGGAHKKAKAQRDEADETDKAIALAMRNAQLATEEQARSHLPRPLEDAIMVKTRSHKMNHVVKSIRDSSTEDKFVIFGDTAELGHCTEILEFFDISWCVFAPFFLIISLRSRPTPTTRERTITLLVIPSLCIAWAITSFPAHTESMVVATAVICSFLPSNATNRILYPFLLRLTRCTR